jgi:hypothetical protein
MKNIWTQFSVAVITALLFLAMLALNQWIFSELEFVRGVNWIYLPAGARLHLPCFLRRRAWSGFSSCHGWSATFTFSRMTGLRAFAGGIMATLALWHLLRSSQMDGARAISQ